MERTAKKINWLALATVLCAAALTGCRSLPVEQGTPFSDEALARELRASVGGLYPTSFRALHRVVLTIGNRQFAFLGHVAGHRPGQLRLAASSEMGGTAFELLRTADGGFHVVRNPASLRGSWLGSGAMRDAVALYLAVPPENAALVRFSDGAVALVAERAGGTREEFRFDAATHRWIEYDRVRKGCVTYRVRFTRDALFAPWPRPAPAAVEIADFDLHYSLSLQVLGLSEAEYDPSVFQVIP